MSDSTNPSLLARAVRNSTYTALGNISTFVIGFIFAGLTIRFLGNARAGFLMTLQAIMGINALIGSFGLGTAAIHRVAHLNAQGDMLTSRAVIGSTISVNVISGLFIAVPLVIFSSKIISWAQLDHSYWPDASLAILLFAAAFVITQISGSWATSFTALERFGLITGLNTVFSLSSGIIGIVVLSIVPTMTAFGFVSVGLSTIQLICNGFFIRKLLGKIPLPAWHWHEVRKMANFGGWAYLGSLGILLFTNLDRLILTNFMGSAILPFYVLPQRIFYQIHTALTNLCQFLFPMFSSYGEKAKNAIVEVEDRLRWFVALLSSIIYIGAYFGGILALKKLVGTDFAKMASIPLLLASIQGIIHAQMIVPYYESWGIGDGRPNAIMPFLNGVFVTIAAILLIPRFGYLGASLSQLMVVIMVTLHTAWVRRLIWNEIKVYDLISCLISPCFVLLTCAIIALLCTTFIMPDSFLFYIILMVGIFISLGVVWGIETILFPKQRRWETLQNAVGIFYVRFRQMISFAAL